MRMMLKVSIPVASGNEAIENETLPKTIMGFVERVKPEAAYFVAEGGNRTGLFFFDMTKAVDLPSIAEPFFLKLGAHIEITPAMNLEDMQLGIRKALEQK